MLGQIPCAVKRVTRIAALNNRREIKNRKGNHARTVRRTAELSSKRKRGFRPLRPTSRVRFFFSGGEGEKPGTNRAGQMREGHVANPLG